MQITPGQTWQRWGTALFAVITVLAYLSWTAGYAPGVVFWLCFALFVLFGLFASATAYQKWMHFAKWLNKWVVGTLFTVIFLTVIPVVWLLRIISGQRSSEAKPGSYWVPKKNRSQSLEDMQSMG